MSGAIEDQLTDLGRFAIQQALEVGFDDAGVAPVSAEPPDADHLREYVQSERYGPLDWMRGSLEKRLRLMAGDQPARSVLVVVLNYYAGDHPSHDPSTTAKVSRYAWGSDYHGFVRKRLRKLRKRLLEEAGDRATEASIRMFCDADAVYDRAWAKHVGLGFTGKNTLLIHPRLGSWVFIGGLATDFELGQSAPKVGAQRCGSCTKCLDACPTQAFLAPGKLDAGRCLTTWNIEKPGAKPLDEPAYGWAAGCDICQEVCPHNHRAQVTNEQRFHPRPGLALFREGEVPEALAGTPLARAGREGLLRSVKRALLPVAKARRAEDAQE